MNRNLNRRIHPIAEADGLSPKKHRNITKYLKLVRLLVTSRIWSDKRGAYM